MSDLAALRAECERLHAEISGPEWEYDPDWGIVMAPVTGAKIVRCAVVAPNYGLRSNSEAERNGRGLAALRNALPAIISALARAEAAERALLSLSDELLEDLGFTRAVLLAAKPNTPATGGERRE